MAEEYDVKSAPDATTGAELMEKLRHARGRAVDDLLQIPLLEPMVLHCRRAGRRNGVDREWEDEFLIRIWRLPERFGDGPPTDRHGQLIRSWPHFFWRIAHNVVASGLERLLRERNPLSREALADAIADEALYVRSAELIALDRADWEHKAMLINEYVAKRDPTGARKLREVMAGICDGEPIAEVARDTGIPENTLKSTWRRFCREVTLAARAESGSDRDPPQGKGVHGA